MRRWQLVIDDTGSVEGIYAFIYCTKWSFGQVSGMPDKRTDGQTLKDRATQLLIKYKSGALVTQFRGATWLQYFFLTKHLGCWKGKNRSIDLVIVMNFMQPTWWRRVLPNKRDNGRLSKPYQCNNLTNLKTHWKTFSSLVMRRSSKRRIKFVTHLFIFNRFTSLASWPVWRISYLFVWDLFRA